MLDLLRKSCPHCTVSSIKTYAQNVKGLAKVAGLKAVPTNANWLTGKLLETIKNKPLNQYKRLAITGVKALGAYGKKDRKWHDAMNDVRPDTPRNATPSSAQTVRSATGPRTGTGR